MTDPDGATRILVAEPKDFSPAALAELRKAGSVDLRAVGRQELPLAFREHDVVWIRLANRIDRSVLGASPRCRVLAVPTTGLDHIDMAACEELGVQVVSLRGEYDFLRDVRATAELTIALALALWRQIPVAAADVLKGKWNRDDFRGHELYGKTAGIVGMGRLGSLVAGYFRAFGMEVLGCDIRDDFPHELAERVTLGGLFLRSDLVTVHVSYNESTRGLIGPAQFNRLKPDAILVNTSRGGIIDDAALLAALESRKLAGAALDVLDGEPDIDGGHPLLRYARDHQNLLIVPHIGGNTFESFAKTELFIARKVVAALLAGRRTV